MFRKLTQQVNMCCGTCTDKMELITALRNLIKRELFMIDWYKKKIQECEEKGDLESLKDYQSMLKILESRDDIPAEKPKHISVEEYLIDPDDCDSCKL